MSEAPEEFDFALGGLSAGAPEGIGQVFFDEIPERAAIEFGAGPESDPALGLRRTLGMFATGVTVITTRAGEQVRGMTVNAFMSVSLEPPLVLVSVDRRARMHALLHEGVRYGISVLADVQEPLSDYFAGRSRGAPEEPRFELVHDTPLVEGALAHLVARVARSYWGGDHSLFLGEVEYARYGEGSPLLFHGGRYERLLADAAASAVPPELVQRFVEWGTERTFAEGEPLMRAGEPGTEVFLVAEGGVRVDRPGRVPRLLGPGELVGEVAVLDRGARTADVVAEEPTRCLAVPREALQAALASDPASAWSLLELLARRFRERA